MQTSWRSRLRTSATSGLLCLSLLLIVLTAAASIASGAPVKVADTKVGEQEITTILLSDKFLGPILVGNLIQLLFFLIKSIWNREKKALDEIKEAVKLIPAIKNEQEKMAEHLRQNVPTHDQVQIKIYESMHRISDAKRGGPI